MNLQHRLLTVAAVMATAVFPPSARALVSLEDGRDHLYIDGSVEIGYDSNVFANAHSGGSMLVEGSLGTEFARRAGWIGVDATASLTFARYANFREQDYVDPKFTAELTKQTGRTTGSLVLSVQRENRADVDVNTRDVSWDYDLDLSIQYPVIERYSISGSFDYSYVEYQNQQLFTNLATYTGSLYLYYLLDAQRDFFIDYRARYSALSNASDDVDNSLSVGVNGRVYGPFNGSLQAGYQVRSDNGGSSAGVYSDFTASGSMAWNMNRRMSLEHESPDEPDRRSVPGFLDNGAGAVHRFDESWAHLQGFLHLKGQRQLAGGRRTEPVPRRRGAGDPRRNATH